MPFIDKKAPKKPRNLKAVFAGGGYHLSWTAPKGSKPLDQAVQYVVYGFSPGQKVNLNDPSHIVLITRSTSVTLPSVLRGNTIVVTALDRLQNESKGVKVKLKNL